MKRPWWWPRREPDHVIGARDDPYLLRWYVIPRNRWANVYLHEFHRDDDDRALHDHPWDFVSWVIHGAYIEHTAFGERVRRRGIALRIAEIAHRVELLAPVVRTLIVTGPTRREWGFWCPQGWRHWRDFTAGARGELPGRGCE